MSLTRCPSGHVYNPSRYGKNCPYCKPKQQEEESETLEAAAGLPQGGFRRIYGWLVCVKGPSAGADYKIHDGKNFIGRGEDMDIQILGDSAISKRNHAVLAYDVKLNVAMLLPGDSEGLVYLGDKAVYTPTELKSYDQVEIGNSVLLYIALCSELFMWK